MAGARREIHERCIDGQRAALSSRSGPGPGIGCQQVRCAAAGVGLENGLFTLHLTFN